MQNTEGRTSLTSLPSVSKPFLHTSKSIGNLPLSTNAIMPHGLKLEINKLRLLAGK